MEDVDGRSPRRRVLLRTPRARGQVPARVPLSTSPPVPAGPEPAAPGPSRRHFAAPPGAAPPASRPSPARRRGPRAHFRLAGRRARAASPPPFPPPALSHSRARAITRCDVTGGARAPRGAAARGGGGGAAPLGGSGGDPAGKG